MRKITIEDEDNKVTIEVKTSNFVHISEYLDQLVIPAMLGLGFSDKLLKEYLPKTEVI